MNQRALFIMIMVLMALGGCSSDQKDADGDFFQGADLAPPSADTLQMSGRILAAKGLDNQAEYLFDRLLREHPNYLSGYTEYAEMLVDQGRIDDARAVIMEGLGVFPDSAVLYNDLGMCELLRKDLSAASEAFSKAMDRDPRDAVYVGNCALVAALEGDEAKARGLWLRVVSRSQAEENIQIARSNRSAFISN